MDSDRLAANLLERGVRGGHQTQARRGLVDGFSEIFDVLGDAKVQQADGAVVLDQNVGGLQVAVNDGVLVGVEDGLADGAE